MLTCNNWNRKILLFFDYKGYIIKLNIWDTKYLDSGCVYFPNKFLQNADIIFLFYDFFEMITFNEITNKMPYLEQQYKRNVLFSLIRNKNDKYGKEEISDEEVLEFADKKNMLFFHLSHDEKNETSIKKLFESVLNE